MDGISTILFIMLLVLISTGWGISFPTLSYLQERWKPLSAIMALLCFCYLFIFFWDHFATDPASSVSEYESIAGIIYLGVRLLIFIYFLYCLQRTLRVDSDIEKKGFYIVFGLGYSLWFTMLPIIVLIAHLLSAWYRFKVVTALYLITGFIGYFVLVFLLWPSRAQKYFVIKVPDVFLDVGYERL